VLVGLHAKREPHPAVAQVPGQRAAAAGAVRADQDRPVGGGQLRQGEIDQLDKVAGRARGGVARPQQAGQGLSWSGATVQVGQQRANPKVCL
jgi:hypothetical protein